MLNGKVGYYADFITYGVLVVALVAFALRQSRHDQLIWLGAAIAGAGSWTLLEYVLHRFVFHHMPLIADLHHAHHAVPRAYLGTPTWASLVVLAGPPHYGTACLAPISQPGRERLMSSRSGRSRGVARLSRALQPLALAQLAPVGFAQLYVIVPGCLLYVGKCDVPLGIADVGHLIESRECAADVRRVRHWFLACSRESKGRLRQRANLRGVQSAVVPRLVRWFPARFVH